MGNLVPIDELGLEKIYALYYKNERQFHTKIWKNIGHVKNHIRLSIPRNNFLRERRVYLKEYLENIQVMEILLDPKLGRIINFDNEKLLSGGDFVEI